MNFNTNIAEFPKEVKLLIGAFLIVLSVGYFTGFRFVNKTTENTPTGIQENYLGNEDDLEAEVMKFRKPKREMLTIIHTHILSMSVIFFILGGLVSFAKLPAWLKKSFPGDMTGRGKKAGPRDIGVFISLVVIIYWCVIDDQKKHY